MGYLGRSHRIFKLPTMSDLVGQDIQIERGIRKRLFGFSKKFVDIVEFDHGDLVEQGGEFGLTLQALPDQGILQHIAIHPDKIDRVHGRLAVDVRLLVFEAGDFAVELSGGLGLLGLFADVCFFVHLPEILWEEEVERMGGRVCVRRCARGCG